jgi:hypothetical protein
MLPKRVHFPWKFVSSELKNYKGEEILFPVNDEQDRRRARRLKWVIKKSTWTGQKTILTSCNAITNPCSVNPGKHTSGSTTRHISPILPSDWMQLTRACVISTCTDTCSKMETSSLSLFFANAVSHGSACLKAIAGPHSMKCATSAQHSCSPSCREKSMPEIASQAINKAWHRVGAVLWFHGLSLRRNRKSNL